MTKAEAAELQVRWTQQMDSPLCVHRKIDLERSERWLYDGQLSLPCLRSLGSPLTPILPFKIDPDQPPQASSHVCRIRAPA